MCLGKVLWPARGSGGSGSQGYVREHFAGAFQDVAQRVRRPVEVRLDHAFGGDGVARDNRIIELPMLAPGEVLAVFRPDFVLVAVSQLGNAGMVSEDAAVVAVPGARLARQPRALHRAGPRPPLHRADLPAVRHRPGAGGFHRQEIHGQTCAHATAVSRLELSHESFAFAAYRKRPVAFMDETPRSRRQGNGGPCWVRTSDSRITSRSKGVGMK